MARTQTKAGEEFRKFSEEMGSLTSRMRFILWAETDPEIVSVIEQVNSASQACLRIAISRNREQAERIESDRQPLFRTTSPSPTPRASEPTEPNQSIEAQAEKIEPPPAIEITPVVKAPIEVKKYRAAQLGIDPRTSERRQPSFKPTDGSRWEVAPFTVPALGKFEGDLLWVVVNERFITGGAVEQELVEVIDSAIWGGPTRSDPEWKKIDGGRYEGELVYAGDRELVLCGPHDSMVIAYPPPSAKEVVEEVIVPTRRPFDEHARQWDIIGENSATKREVWAGRISTNEADEVYKAATILFGGNDQRAWSLRIAPADAMFQDDVIRAGGYSGHGPGRWIWATVAADLSALTTEPTPEVEPSKPARRSPQKTFQAAYFPAPDSPIRIDLGEFMAKNRAEAEASIADVFRGREVEVNGQVEPIDPTKVRIVPAPSRSQRKKTGAEAIASGGLPQDGSAIEPDLEAVLTAESEADEAEDLRYRQRVEGATDYGGPSAFEPIRELQSSHRPIFVAWEHINDRQMPSYWIFATELEEARRVIIDRMPRFGRPPQKIEPIGELTLDEVQRTAIEVKNPILSPMDVTEEDIPEPAVELPADEPYRNLAGHLTFLARGPSAEKLYTVEAVDEAAAEAVIAEVDAKRPEASREAFAVSALEALTEQQIRELPFTVKPLRVKAARRPSLAEAARSASPDLLTGGADHGC